MNNDPSRIPVEVIPSLRGEVSALASASAPIIFFDKVPIVGHANGVLRITLEAIRDMPMPQGGSGADRVVVAHLRMSVASAKALRVALDRALLLAAPAAKAD